MRIQKMIAGGWLALLFFLHSISSFATEHPTLPIGASAPDFSLKSVDDKIYSLNSFADKKILVVIFTCNHCPTAQAYEDRIIQLTKDYLPKGVAVVAIMPNDPKSITPSELDYTDLSDSFAEMKIRARQKKFNFPYLYDGDEELAAKAYGPVATPHVFIFDAARKLRYQGRIDDMENPAEKATATDTRNAIDALLNGGTVQPATTKVFGCSVKWIEKSDWIIKAQENWAKESVSLQEIDVSGIKELLQNKSGKLRLINVWATWCGPCVAEFPDFITINRMYRKRNFEFISISADNLDKKEKALIFLKEQQASSKNFLFKGKNKYDLIDAIDPNWAGGIPYTILVEPGGKIVYAKQGAIDVLTMKTMIIDHPLMGRYY